MSFMEHKYAVVFVSFGFELLKACCTGQCLYAFNLSKKSRRNLFHDVISHLCDTRRASS